MLEGWVLKGYYPFLVFIVNINFTINPTLHYPRIHYSSIHYSSIPAFQL